MELPNRRIEHERQKGLILVIEDDHWMREVMTDLLVHEGFRVAEATQMSVGRRLLRAIRPAAVVLDLALGGTKSGLELLWECTDGAETRTVPVVVVSAYADLLPSEALAGAARALQKPIDLDELLLVLNELAGASAHEPACRSRHAPGTFDLPRGYLTPIVKSPGG